MRSKSRYRKNLPKPDIKFSNIIVSQFINKIMRSGKKATAQKIVYDMFAIIGKKFEGIDSIVVFEQALKNAAPLLEVRSKRIGGATYQVPTEVRPERKVALAMRWIIQAASIGQGKSMSEFLAEEVINAYNNTGSAIKKKEEMHKMAEANRAFAHFARF